MSTAMAVRRRVAVAAMVGAALLLVLQPVETSAHPLGNFTINHYAGLRIGESRVLLDVVIDMAEIPAIQEQQRLDLDADGVVSDAETEAERVAACGRLADSLLLTVDGAAVLLRPAVAGLSFPPGFGGAPTLRLVCGYEARLDGVAPSRAIRFRDDSYASRIGWREIVVEGDGVAIHGPGVTATGTSARLTAYPEDLLDLPLDVREASFTATPGGPDLGEFEIPDADPLPGAAPLPDSATGGPDPGSGGAVPGGIDAAPGSLEAALADSLRGELSLPLVASAVLLAALAGAFHAVTPGHGKTVMAAYLVGSRGTARHAVGLGLTVTLSHTLGVVGLAVATLAASSVVPPELLQRWLGLVAGGLVIAIGLWLLVGRYRAWAHEREHAAEPLAASGPGPDDRGPRANHGPEHHGGDPHLAVHSHGGIRHSHLPAGRTTLTWRSLFVLGLAGGLVPSIPALLILLVSIALDRVVFGLVLIVAFGAGMAVVLSGVGLVLVYASGLVLRIRPRGTAGRFAALVPVATALVVVVAGLYLTTRALGTGL